ncbi:MAG: hypothetical protein M3014_07010 [Chloroflexota bacterium]|nr:hypothetical protein [Chloroflexota bacterium]
MAEQHPGSDRDKSTSIEKIVDSRALFQVRLQARALLWNSVPAAAALTAAVLVLPV